MLPFHSTSLSLALSAALCIEIKTQQSAIIIIVKRGAYRTRQIATLEATGSERLQAEVGSGDDHGAYEQRGEASIMASGQMRQLSTRHTHAHTHTVARLKPKWRTLETAERRAQNSHKPNRAQKQQASEHRRLIINCAARVCVCLCAPFDRRKKRKKGKHNKITEPERQREGERGRCEHGKSASSRLARWDSCHIKSIG